MTAPIYGLFADVHAHNWSSFAKTLPTGRNSRLQIILDEMDRMTAEVKKAGGESVVFAGDLFHKRGSIDPEVFNPVFDAITNMAEDLTVYMMPGNHDLKSRETTSLGNAFAKMDEINNVVVVHEPTPINVFPGHDVLLIPWISEADRLRAVITDWSSKMTVGQKADLILHAGISGVIPGLPHSELDPAFLAATNFHRIFAGHYHAHKVMEAGKVVSIGALTHQTWSDVNTRAGFLRVEPDAIHHHASHAPEFIDIDAETDMSEIPLLVDGNYVRVRDLDLDEAGIKALEKQLVGLNAAGVSIQVVRKTVSARGVSPAKGASISESIDKYVDDEITVDPAEVKQMCADVLKTVEELTA